MEKDKPIEAITKMQEIADRLISTTPQLASVLESGAVLRRELQPHATVKRLQPISTKKKIENSQKLMASRGETTVEVVEKNKELAAMVSSLREKLAQQEQQLRITKRTNAQRELQFKGHIQELQAELKGKSVLEGDEKGRMGKIVQLHGQIMDNINVIQKNTSRILIQQESQIIQFFNKKIKEIKDRFRKDRIDKGQKDQEYLLKEKQLVNELEWIKSIAQKIDTQNHNLSRKYLELKAQYQILQKDRQNLFKELILQKKKIAVLENQQQQSKQKDQEFRPQIRSQEREQRVHSPDSFSEFSGQPSESSGVGPVNQKVESIIKSLNSTLQREQKKVRQLKRRLMTQLESKSELQKILRECVEDVKDEILLQEGMQKRKGKDGASKEQRQQLIDKLLQDERVLGMLYDKTFFRPNQRKP